MFLDKIECTITKIDDQPCERNARIVFWSDGKVEAWTDEHEEKVGREEVKRFLATVGRYYGVTASEFEAAMTADR